MAPLAFPVGPAVRWVIYGGTAALDFLAAKSYDTQFTELSDQDDAEWRHIQMVFNRLSPAGTTEDVAVCTFDLINITEGAVDPTWTSGDYTTVNGHFLTWWNGQKANTTSNVVLKELRYYRANFTPGFHSGPPSHIYTINVAGTVANTEALPYQVACSITEKTALAKQWGRFYLPGIPKAALDTFGRWKVANILDYANKVETLYESLWAAQFVPIVPAPALLSILPVEAIQVDDIPDVQRRRRAKTTLLREIRVLA